jgi:hypothetical protein
MRRGTGSEMRRGMSGKFSANRTVVDNFKNFRSDVCGRMNPTEHRTFESSSLTL